jgi:hypothetical protein
MPVIQQLIHRFEELEVELSTIRWRRSESSGSSYATGDEWRRWATSAMHLIRTAFGEASPHYANFKAVYDRCVGYDHEFAELKGVFLGASADYRGGYVVSVEMAISGEVLGNFVAMAKLALDDGHKDVAAVLACAALEDTLKRFARLNGVDVDDKVLQEVVAALKSKGLVGGAQKSLLDVMPKIRDFAMHANWSKIQDADVRSVLGFVEQFLLTKFG